MERTGDHYCSRRILSRRQARWGGGAAQRSVLALVHVVSNRRAMATVFARLHAIRGAASARAQRGHRGRPPIE